MNKKEKNLRVMQIVSAPTPGRKGGNSVNGPELMAANIINCWTSRFIKPVVVYPRRGRLWEIFQKSGCPLVAYEIDGKFDFRAIQRLAKIVRDHRVQLIHTQGPGSLDFFSAIASLRLKVPLVVTRQSMLDDLVVPNQLKKRIYKFIDLFTQRNAEVLVVVSQTMKDRFLRDNPAIAPKIRVVYNGVNLNRFFRIRSTINSSSIDSLTAPSFVLGMVGQLKPGKGWHDFLRVIRALHEKHLPVRGLIVGDGPLREELKGFTVSLGIEKIVEFTGQQENVDEQLARMDIFLFTSYREGLSVAVVEALAAGLPIVATRVGGIHEQVTERGNGFLVDAGDVKTMTHRCEMLISEESLRSSFGRRSRLHAEQYFSEDLMVNSYADCYRQAVKSFNKI